MTNLYDAETLRKKVWKRRDVGTDSHSRDESISHKYSQAKNVQC